MSKYNRIEEFEKKRQNLLDQGFTEHEGTISALKANLMAFVTAGPIAVVCAIIYFTLRSTRSFTINLMDNLLFIVFLIVSVIVHELIHGITWSFFCKNKFKSVHFGVMWEMLTPYCYCEEALAFTPYILGGLMPFFILGIGSFIISLCTGSMLIFILSMFNILAAGGDTTIVLMLLKYRKAVILDHPSKCGFVAFMK